MMVPSSFWLISTGLLLALSLFGCGMESLPSIEPKSALPEGAVSPRNYATFIPQGDIDRYTVTVDLSDPPPSRLPVDVLMVFDYTSSMERQINPMRANAVAIINRFRRSFPDTRFAVAAFADYVPLFSSNPVDKPWIVHSDFTTSAQEISSALGRIQLGYGGDAPEAYSRAIYESAFMRWRPQAQKIVVIFGDSVAHTVDPGRDGRLGTRDDLTFEQAVQQLVKAGVKAIGIFEPKSPEVSRQFEYLARQTGGQAIPLDDASHAADAFVAGLASNLRMIPELRASDEFADWISNISAAHEISPTRFAFAVTLHVPEQADAGKKQVYLTAHHGDGLGTPIGRANVAISTGLLNSPAVQTALLGILGALPLLPMLRRRLPDLEVLYFNLGTLWRRGLVRGLGYLLLLAYYLGLAWTYYELRKPDAPALTEIVQSGPRLMSLGRTGLMLKFAGRTDNSPLWGWAPVPTEQRGAA